MNNTSNYQMYHDDDDDDDIIVLDEITPNRKRLISKQKILNNTGKNLQKESQPLQTSPHNDSEENGNNFISFSKYRSFNDANSDAESIKLSSKRSIKFYN